MDPEAREVSKCSECKVVNAKWSGMCEPCYRREFPLTSGRLITRDGSPQSSSEVILRIAGKVDEHCARLVLEWGDAIRRHQANPTDELLQKAREACRACGELGVALSQGLGREL